jgi:hypothetical protein
MSLPRVQSGEMRAEPGYSILQTLRVISCVTIQIPPNHNATKESTLVENGNEAIRLEKSHYMRWFEVALVAM